MKKIILGSLLSIVFAFLIISVLKFFITIPKIPQLRDVKVVKIDKKVSKVFDIKEKIVVQKKVNNTNYLNSWKLTATIVGSKSFAMVIKGRDSKVLRINDILEGYKVKQIKKDKMLLSTKSDDVWLYIKTKKIKLQKNGIVKVAAKVGTYSIRKASFNRNVLKPEKLLKTVNILPEMESGRFQGMKVQSLLEGSFLYVYGLRQGDIIKKINGKKLLSIADGITAYQNISTSSKFSLSVLRDNKIEEFKYEIIK